MGKYVDVLDDTGWPVLYVRLSGGFDTDGFDRFASWHEQRADRAVAAGTRFVSVTDARGVGGAADAAERKHIAAWLDSLSPAQAAASMLGILILDSVIARGVVRAIQWVSPPRTRTIVVASPAEAWDRAIEVLREAGVPAPARPQHWPTD